MPRFTTGRALSCRKVAELTVPPRDARAFEVRAGHFFTRRPHAGQCPGIEFGHRAVPGTHFGTPAKFGPRLTLGAV